MVELELKESTKQRQQKKRMKNMYLWISGAQ